MSKGKNQHIVKHNEGWAVKGEGNSKATVVAPTKQEAIEAGKSIAKNQSSELVIHGKDGRYRRKTPTGMIHILPRDNSHYSFRDWKRIIGLQSPEH
jgi:hypothetical protein